MYLNVFSYFNTILGIIYQYITCKIQKKKESFSCYCAVWSPGNDILGMFKYDMCICLKGVNAIV